MHDLSKNEASAARRQKDHSGLTGIKNGLYLTGMLNRWTPQREPDDVPSPIAIALSDFCRRAQAPAPPALVRVALAYLAAEEDFLVENLAHSPPPCCPLGPFAVIDILKGTPPDVASLREKKDAYAWAAQLPLLPPAPSAAPPSIEEPSPQMDALLPPSSAAAPSPASKKTWSIGKAKKTPPHKPRGRFVQVEPGKENIRALFRLDAKERLLALLQSAHSQAALLNKLSSQFRGEGETLTWQEVRAVLEYHGMMAVFEDRERKALEAGLLRFRCSLDKLSKAWGLRPVELKKRMEELSLNDAFNQLRKRFAAEILGAPNLNHQLRVFSRPGYLKDLGVASALKRQLATRLKSLLAQLPAEFDTPETQLQELTKKHQLDADLLAVALQQLKLF